MIKTLIRSRVPDARFPDAWSFRNLWRPFCAGLLALVLLVSPGTGPLRGDESETPRGNLRILTHNVYLGFSRGNAPHQSRWREWIGEQAPDVVSLQELNGYTAERLAADAASWGHPHSVILKEEGFPTGLTSRWPIEDVVRLREGFHHGLLRGKVAGIYVYAIHFHSHDWEHRIREAKLLEKDISSLPEDDPKIVLAGDFNGFSPADRVHYENTPSLEPFFEMLDRRNPRAKNLRAGRIDYGGIESILQQGFVDLGARFRNADEPFTVTFPSSLVEDEDHGPDRRLDYIFVSANLVGKVTDFRLFRDEETALFSDHFPLSADIALD